MLTTCESNNTVDLGEYFAILPSGGDYSIDDYCKETGGIKVGDDFSYNSGKNEDF
jgi:UDP-N-acetylglucosamine 4,6-dehydratase